jgi:hypothetical protein
VVLRVGVDVVLPEHDLAARRDGGATHREPRHSIPLVRAREALRVEDVEVAGVREVRIQLDVHEPLLSEELGATEVEERHGIGLAGTRLHDPHGPRQLPDEEAAVRQEP